MNFLCGFRHLVCLIIFIASCDVGAQKNIVSTEIIVDKELVQSNINAMTKYLKRYIGKSANDKNIKGAQRFLKGLYFVSEASCKIVPTNLSAKLICHVDPKILVKEITIKNLRASLLETELKRKLPLQVGQLIDFSEKATDEIKGLTRTRIETFLRKNGFYGAKVTVSLHKVPGELAIRVEANIERGEFARVNEIYIEGDSPLRPATVRNIYRRRCLSFNRIFDAIALGSLSCYSAELEREATEQLQQRLAEIGYVQASIRVRHHWIDPHDEKAPKHCRKKNLDDHTARCINLRIDINKGPLVRWSITMKDGHMVSRNAFERLMSSIFAVDPLSRATAADESGEVPADRMIIKEELEQRINFIESKNLDEQELKLSVEKMKEYLVSKGYINAEIVPSVVRKDANNIRVDFQIFAGQPFSIRSVEVGPEPFTELFSDDEREQLLKVRSLGSPGNLAYPQVSDALEQVVQRAHDKGYNDATAQVQISSLDLGDVQVRFFLQGDVRETISQIVINNGDAALDEELTPLLKNCDNFNMKTKSCKGSSLVRDAIGIDEAKIVNFYQANDYLYAKTRSELIEGKDGFTLIFNIFDERYGENSKKALRPQIIKDIILSGNRTTRESVIKRLFPHPKNIDELNSISIKKGVANLRESGRFSQIEYKLMAGQENSNDIYFAMQLVERPSLTLDTGIAISTDKLLSLEAEVEESNLFSSMLTLKTKLGLGFFWGRQSSLSNKFVWPFIWGKPFSFSLHAPMITYDDKTHRLQPFRRLQSRVVAGIDWRANSYLMPYIRYSFVHNKEKAGIPPSISASEQFKSLDGLIPLIREAPGEFAGVLKPGISFIKLDNPLDPHSGVDSNNWVEISGKIFQGHPPFINVGTQNRYFLPLGSCTLAFQLTLMRAFIEPTSHNFIHLQKFSSLDNLGGDRSVRGYEDGFLGIDSVKGPTGPYSGYFSNTANVELRFPLTDGGGIGKLSGGLFVDQGSLVPCSNFWDCDQEQSLEAIVRKRGLGFSVGAGLRYILPVGPISLDYAISPLLANSGKVHFQFGYAF